MTLETLQERVVLVTGAGSGIGRALALALVEAGAVVYALGRDAAVLNELSRSVQAEGKQLESLIADVADAAQVQSACEQVLNAHGRIDILVNNAGVMYLAPIRDGELADWTAMIQTNLIGVLNTVHAVLPSMLAHRHGDILNLSSISARLSGPGTGVYSASKKAVEIITESMRQELAGTGVRMASVQMGGVATGLNDKIRNKSMRRLIKMRGQSYHDLPVDVVVHELLHVLTRPRCLNAAATFLLSSDQAS